MPPVSASLRAKFCEQLIPTHLRQRRQQLRRVGEDRPVKHLGRGPRVHSAAPEDRRQRPRLRGIPQRRAYVIVK